MTTVKAPFRVDMRGSGVGDLEHAFDEREFSANQGYEVTLI